MWRVFKFARVFELPAYPTFPSTVHATRLASLGDKQSATIEQRSCYPDHGHNDPRRQPDQDPYYRETETETPVLPLQILSRGPLRQARRHAVRAHLLPQVRANLNTVYSCMRDAYSVLCTLTSV